MVHIIDGEVFQDNDPRIQEVLAARERAARQQSASSQGPAAPAAASNAGGQPGFDLNAPPFRTVPPADGTQNFFRLPDIEIFGLRLTPYMLLAVAFAVSYMGWSVQP